MYAFGEEARSIWQFDFAEGDEDKIKRSIDYLWNDVEWMQKLASLLVNEIARKEDFQDFKEKIWGEETETSDDSFY